MNKENFKEQEFVGFANTVLYSPVPYLPQALAINLSKAFQRNAIFSLYLARIFNLIFYLTVLSVALFLLCEINKKYALVLFLLAAMPMSIFEASSASADALTYGIAFLVVALGMSLSLSWSRRKFIIFLIFSTLLALTKNIYFLIPLMILPIIFQLPDSSIKEKLKMSLMVFFAIFIPLLVWSLITKKNYVPVIAGVRPKQQIIFMMQNLSLAWPILKETFRNQFTLVKDSFIGTLGWFDVVLSPQLIKIYYYLIGLAAITGLSLKEKNKIKNIVWRLLTNFIIVFFLLY